MARACQAGALRASRVVLATAAHTGDLWPGLAQTIAPMTSYQLATEPLGLKLAAQILPVDEACSDARNDLRYFRKDRGGRLISGRALAIQLMVRSPLMQRGKTII